MKYTYITAWGILTGSFRYYVDEQIAQAGRDNAPLDAIFKRANGTWAVVGDIGDAQRKASVMAFANDPKATVRER